MMKSNVEKLQEQIRVLLTSKGLVVDEDPIAEFIMGDRDTHPAMFVPESLPEGNLWFGAGSLVEEDIDTEAFAVTDGDGYLLALAVVEDDVAEVWTSQTHKWKQVEDW